MNFLDKASELLGTAVENLSRIDDAMDEIAQHVEKGLDAAEDVLFSLQEQVEKARAKQREDNVWADISNNFFTFKKEPEQSKPKAKEDYTHIEKLDFVLPFLERDGGYEWRKIRPGGSLRATYENGNSVVILGLINRHFNKYWKEAWGE